MVDELAALRDQLCRNSTEYCRDCFATTPYAAVQNPPNVFRVGNNRNAKVFFVFDKPNNNDAFRHSDLVPITICDPRPFFGSPSTHVNLLLLYRQLGIASTANLMAPLDSEFVHITNAVKCDKCALDGGTGRVGIGESQAKRCVSHFLLKELEIIKPAALVFFGEAPQRNVLGCSSPFWAIQKASVAGVPYWIMRVPHTSATSFNTHGRRGAAYVEPFRRLMEVGAA